MIWQKFHVRHLDVFPQAVQLNTVGVVDVDVRLLGHRKVLVIVKPSSVSYRLAQLQDALLRDARFIVGIRMHTQGMTIPQAEEFFQKEGYQPKPVATSETKRGTSDATYGYYTMGKLMILKLRDDYKVMKGSQYSLQNFHDTFISLGQLPLPLVRKAMLGSAGELFR